MTSDPSGQPTPTAEVVELRYENGELRDALDRMSSLLATATAEIENLRAPLITDELRVVANDAAESAWSNRGDVVDYILDAVVPLIRAAASQNTAEIGSNLPGPDDDERLAQIREMDEYEILDMLDRTADEAESLRSQLTQAENSAGDWILAAAQYRDKMDDAQTDLNLANGRIEEVRHDLHLSRSTIATMTYTQNKQIERIADLEDRLRRAVNQAYKDGYTAGRNHASGWSS